MENKMVNRIKCIRGDCCMQDDEGEYVLYENYEKLENRCDKLCKNIDGKNERLRVLISGIQQLEANLSKAIDIGEWFFDRIPDNEMDNAFKDIMKGEQDD